MPRPRLAVGLASAALAAALVAPPIAAQGPVAGEIRARVERLRSAGALDLAGHRLARSAALVEAYERASFEPLWTDPGAQLELARALEELPADGLDPDRYHRAAIDRSARAEGAGAAADLDLLRTAALLELARDLRVGRARPALPGIGRDFAGPADEIDATVLAEIIRSGRIREQVDRFRPRHFVYQGLRAGLARLRSIAAAGGWESVPAGRSLRRDSADARIPALRRRLLAEGYAAADTGSLTRYDAPLERAVRAFQHHHGLNEDGIVGERTRAALNVTVAQRIDQVRANLERARWLSPALPSRFVGVNTAAAKVYFVDAQRVVFETRAIVGREYTETPVFSATLRTVELDPTWTVPPGIVDEVLDEVRRDPGYLARMDMRLLDASGRAVSPRAVDFSRSAASFPYTFRQEPGPANPLGRIKLLFPNRYNVYLHDTPSRSLFASEERNFSHGCIRVEDPFRLAELALDDPQWTRASLAGATGTGRPRTIPLARPLPVLVFYWTASADERGELHFYRDGYGRDSGILDVIGRTAPAGGIPTATRRALPTEIARGES